MRKKKRRGRRRKRGRLLSSAVERGRRVSRRLDNAPSREPDRSRNIGSEGEDDRESERRPTKPSSLGSSVVLPDFDRPSRREELILS